MKVFIFFLAAFLLGFSSSGQSLSIGAKGGYCKYVALNKMAFPELVPEVGYAGVVAAAIAVRYQTKQRLAIDFSITKLANKYVVPFSSDHEVSLYEGHQQLLFSRASLQYRIGGKKEKPGERQFTFYIGPSVGLGLARILEFKDKRTFSLAIAGGLSASGYFRLANRLKLGMNLEYLHLIQYDESAFFNERSFDRNGLLFIESALYYEL